jgi:serine/threonine protein kinase
MIQTRRFNGSEYNSEYNGEFISNYTIDKEKVGEGAQGVVSSYIHNKTGTRIALKRVYLDLYTQTIIRQDDPSLSKDEIKVPNDVYVASKFQNILPCGILDLYVSDNAMVTISSFTDIEPFEIKWKDYTHIKNESMYFMCKRFIEECMSTHGTGYMVTVAFDIFMDYCEGSLESIQYELISNPVETYTMLKEVVYQLTSIYKATKLIYVDMKIDNILYRNSPRQYFVGDFGSFYESGKNCLQKYRIPYDMHGKMDAYCNEAHDGFGIWSIFQLLKNCIPYTLTFDNCPYIDVVLNKWKTKQYENPYVDSMHDMLTIVAYAILFPKDTDDANHKSKQQRIQSALRWFENQ